MKFPDDGGQRFLGYEIGASCRHEPFPKRRFYVVEPSCGIDLEHGVSHEFEPFIVFEVLVFVGVGGMRERPHDEVFIVKSDMMLTEKIKNIHSVIIP